jgi:type I restriction enzyme S subunit
MMREYKKYDEYKDSGVEWIGEIPKSWSQSKYKYYFFSSMGNTILKEDLIVDGSIPIYSATESDDIFGYVNNANVILNKNDFVIPARGNSIGNITLVNSDIATCTQTTIYSKKVNDINKKYIYYFLDGLKEYLFSFTRTAIPQITVKQVSNNNILVPPKIEQQKIASFLDQKTAEIDEIITKKEILIDYLEKYKKSVITEAVTKGKLGDKYINENGEFVDEIEMKDSGVEWIGEIPEYWGLIRLKFLAKIKNGKKQDKVETKNGEYPILGSGGEFSRANDYLYDKPSVLLGRKGTIDNPQYIEEPFWTVDTLFYTKIKDIIIPKLFYYLTKTIRFDYYSTQTALPSMTQEDLNQIPFPLYKNKIIQRIIVDFIDNKNAQINKLIQKTKQSIEKYKEYKKSLIFEAVTGKIDLRDYELEGGEELVEHNNSSETERERLSAVD